MLTLSAALLSCGGDQRRAADIHRQDDQLEGSVGSATQTCGLSNDPVVHRLETSADHTRFLLVSGSLLGIAEVIDRTISGETVERLLDAETAICRFMVSHATRIPREYYRRYYRYYRVYDDTIEVQFHCRADAVWLAGTVPDDGGACYVLFTVNSAGVAGLPVVNGGAPPDGITTGNFGGREYRLRSR